MATFDDLKAEASDIYRDMVAPGSIEENDPDKARIRNFLNQTLDTMEGISKAAVGGYLSFVTWAELAAVTDKPEGATAVVTGPDAGTHTDPVVGGTVDNEGAYTSNGAGAWRRTGNTASVDAQQALDEITIKVEENEATINAAVAEVIGDDVEDEYDTPEPLFGLEVDEDGNVVFERLADGRIDFEPGPRIMAKLGVADTSGVNNLPADTVIGAARDVPEEDRRRVWSDADVSPLWRYSIRMDDASLGTAVPEVSFATLVIWYGQSNAEGNSGGELVNGTPPSPRRALMLSTGMRGTGDQPSNAASIPDFLPAHEALSTSSAVLGESPATSMMASLITRDGDASPTLYVGRVPAKGGFRADQLASGTVPFTNMVAEVERISALLAIHGITDLRVIVAYLQGETDATSSTPIATYKTTLTTLLNAVRTQLGAVDNVTEVKIVLCQAATNALSSIYPNDPAAAQFEIARDDATGDIFLGEPNYQFPLSSYPSDNYHTSGAAKAALGRKTARTYKRLLAGQPTSVMPDEAAIARVGNTIVIPFDTPGDLALAIDPDQPAIADLGFQVFDGPGAAANEVVLSGVSITGAREVTIDCGIAAQAGWEVRYAHDGVPVAGWLGARGTLATVVPGGGDDDRYHCPVFIHVLD